MKLTLYEEKIAAAVVGVDPDAVDFRAQVLDKARIQFLLAPNPMLARSAFRWARDYGLDIPVWVLDYLYDETLELTEIVAKDGREEEAQEVGRTLGFGAAGKGGTTAGAELRQDWRYLIIAVRANVCTLGVGRGPQHHEKVEPETHRGDRHPDDLDGPRGHRGGHLRHEESHQGLPQIAGSVGRKQEVKNTELVRKSLISLAKVHLRK